MQVGFIYNPESGTGKIKKYIPWISNEFKKAGHELVLLKTSKPKDATKFAMENHHFKMLLVAGGDGTLNEVVNGLMKFGQRPYIGYIPTGTANDVGNLLGMSYSIKRSVKRILKEPYILAMDISKINDRYFTYAAATGLFSKASYDIEQSEKKKLRRLAYVIRGSKEIFKKHNVFVKVYHDGGSFEGNYALILLLNGYRIGGLKLFFLKSSLDDGIISGRFFQQKSGVLLRILWFFLTGGFYDTRKNRTIKSSYFKIETKDHPEWNTDGEKAFTGSAEIKVINKALRFVVTEKAAKKHFTNYEKRKN